MSTLQCVVYVSTATAPMTSAQLEALLIEARVVNRHHQVTGVLLYSDGDFMQYFEGPEEAVSATYARIRKSRKHTGIIELLNESVAKRHFDDWQMGFARPTRSDLLALSTARWKQHDDAFDAGQSSSSGIELLRDFWRRTAVDF